MRLELLRLAEKDANAYCNICWAAFNDAFMGLMYPNGYTESARAWAKGSLLEDRQENPDRNRIMKVIDHDLPESDSNGKVIGIGYWKFYTQERTQADLDAEDKKSEEKGHPPDCNVALLDEFHGNIDKYKREILGRQPYVLLNVLAVLPEYHRKGVGGMLIKEGLQQADQLGLQSYLEASPMGRALYQRMGYEQVREFEFDARKWGLDRDLPHVCMLRPAQVANGQS